MIRDDPHTINDRGDASGGASPPSVADRLQFAALERDLAAAEADNADLRRRLARVKVRLSRRESVVFAGDGGEGE
jgi:hypothetical protein